MKGGREGEGEEEGEGELCEKQRGGESEERLQFLAAQFLRERKRERESSAKSTCRQNLIPNFHLYMTLSGTFSTGLSWKGKYPPPGEWQS